MDLNQPRRPATVLLVEDNEGDIILTKEALRDAKLHVALECVGDGYEAMAYLRREGIHADAARPDLILLDLNMPKMDGREFLEIVKKDVALRKIPVVVLTTSEAEIDIHKSYDLQANCFITKPLDFDQFQVVVNQIKDFWFTLVCLPPRSS